MIGYIKLYRQLFENPDYFKTRFDEIRAWIDLLLLANYEDKTIKVGRTDVEVKRGQVAKSVQMLADRWQWSKHTVLKFLKIKEEEGQIALPKKFPISLITIVNYEKYQGFDEKTAPPLAPPLAPPKKEKVSPNTPLKESNETSKEGKEEKEPNNKLLVKKKNRPPTTAPMEERKKWLVDSMKEADNGIPKLMLNEFYFYWTETTSSGRVMRFELEKTWVTSRRLARWINNNQDKKWK